MKTTQERIAAGWKPEYRLTIEDLGELRTDLADWYDNWDHMDIPEGLEDYADEVQAALLAVCEMVGTLRREIERTGVEA